MRSLPIWVSALFLLTTAAGCISDAGTKDASAAPSNTLDASGGTEAADAGSLRGLVVDEELTPVSGAGVALLKTDFQVTTDADGTYAFLNIPAGVYTIVAQKLGYDSKALKAEVKPGQTTWANVTLAALPTVNPYHITSQHTAILQCMLATPAWVSSCSYPYTAVYLTAQQNGVNLSSYGAPSDIMDNKWRYNYTVEYGAQGVVSELIWTAASDTAKLMNLRQCKPEYDPVLDDCPQYAAKAGPSPLNVPWGLSPKDSPKDPGGVTWVMSAVWPDFDATPGVDLDQKIDMYNTIFYYAPPPDGFSVLNQA